MERDEAQEALALLRKDWPGPSQFRPAKKLLAGLRSAGRFLFDPHGLSIYHADAVELVVFKPSRRARYQTVSGGARVFDLGAATLTIDCFQARDDDIRDPVADYLVAFDYLAEHGFDVTLPTRIVENRQICATFISPEASDCFLGPNWLFDQMESTLELDSEPADFASRLRFVFNGDPASADVRVDSLLSVPELSGPL